MHGLPGVRVSATPPNARDRGEMPSAINHLPPRWMAWARAAMGGPLDERVAAAKDANPGDHLYQSPEHGPGGGSAAITGYSASEARKMRLAPSRRRPRPDARGASAVAASLQRRRRPPPQAEFPGNADLIDAHVQRHR